MILLGVALVTGAQNGPDLKSFSPKQLKKLAKGSIRKDDLFTAIYLYERYTELKPNDYAAIYELAELDRKTRSYENAKELYEKVIKKDESDYPLARFYYAKMLKETGNYDEAIKEFTKFRNDYRYQKDSREYNHMVRNEINGCDSAKLILQNPLNLTIESLNSTVNGPHMELSPIPLSDSVFMYASLRTDSLVFFNQNNVDTARPVRQFYLAHKKGLDWIGGEKVGPPIDIPGVETGNGVLSHDGKRFYFNRCFKNWKGENICSIYLTKKKKNGWTQPEKLPPVINDPNYTSTEPALGQTVRTGSDILYFVSNRPDGHGKLDIWYSIYNSKKQLYSKPRNLGGRINTSGNDMTPYYDLSTKTLYYSSDGKAGMGGLDIYKSFGDRFKWTKVQNMGAPLNSSYDDLYFTISPTGEFGFLVSNRPETGSPADQTCCDNIFYYRWNEFIRIGVTGKIYPFEKDKYGRKRDLSNFDFMNPPDSIKPLDHAVIALYMQNKETKEYVFMARDTTDTSGTYFFNLLPDQEYEFRMEGFQYFDSKDYLSTDMMNFSDTIDMPPTWVNVLTDKPVVLENIYYEFNKTELTDQSKRVLDTTVLVMMKEAPEFIVEIGSHTDSVGSESYNLKLSQERADNVVKYLISKGISADRLVAKGYGASKPIAPNTNPDGSDNPQGREKNRRTEFRVIGTLNNNVDEESQEEY